MPSLFNIAYTHSSSIFFRFGVINHKFDYIIGLASLSYIHLLRFKTCLKMLQVMPKQIKLLGVMLKSFRNKKDLVKKISGSGNLVHFAAHTKLDSCLVEINGDNNAVQIDGLHFSNLKIIVQGNNHNIKIEEGTAFNLSGTIWVDGEGNSLSIGRDCSIESANIALTENKSKISIGNNCLFSYGIDIRNGDSHSIIDLKTGQRINPVQDILIGNKVWIGARVTVLKGTQIQDNSVVALGAIVTKKFSQGNVVLGGVPAKILRQGVDWTTERL